MKLFVLICRDIESNATRDLSLVDLHFRISPAPRRDLPGPCVGGFTEAGQRQEDPTLALDLSQITYRSIPYPVR
jgi:hypothetical protein